MTLVPGEEAEANVTFPDDFAEETKRGQTMAVRISLQEAKRLQLPEVDDDFAREMGDFDSVAELEKAVRQDLETAASREADAGVRRQLMEQIIAANQVPAPRPLVDKLIAAYAKAYEVGEEQSEKFASEFGPIAEGQVKRDLVIEQVAAQESLAATEEELDQRVEEIAQNRKMDPGKVYASLQRDNRLRELERSITDEKVYRFLLEQSTITES
jgi:trigger factor